MSIVFGLRKAGVGTLLVAGMSLISGCGAHRTIHWERDQPRVMENLESRTKDRPARVFPYTGGPFVASTFVFQSDSLGWSGSVSGVESPLALSDIDGIVLDTGSMAFEGAGQGVASGALAGVLVGFLRCLDCTSPSSKIGPASFKLGLFGAIVGAFVGAFTKSTITFQP